MIMHKSLIRCNPKLDVFLVFGAPIFQARFESLFLIDPITLFAVEPPQYCVVIRSPGRPLHSRFLLSTPRNR
jgi:hypothetical protein